MSIFDPNDLRHLAVLKQYIASKTGIVEPPTWCFHVSQYTAMDMCASLWISEHPLERAIAESMAHTGHQYRLEASSKITSLEEMRGAYEGLSLQFAHETCWQLSAERKLNLLRAETEELEASMLRMHDLLQEAMQHLPDTSDLKWRIHDLLVG